MSLRILVTGSKGQLGNELRRCLESGDAEIGAIPAEYRDAHVDYIDYDVLDISDASAVDAWFAENAYDIVINCAAITNVDGCETDEVGAYKVNAQGPANLSRASAAQGAKIVHVSTDYVFPGNEEGQRTEDDPTCPISAYGRTKLAGEKAASRENSKCFVCRTSWLYGYVGKNFVKTMRRLGESHDRITVVSDQLGNPTSANDVAYHILKVALTGNYGIYHMTNNGTCSWADFASRIMEKSGLSCEVVPVTSAEYKVANPNSADRPHFSSLQNKHLQDTVGDEFRSWQDAIDMFIERLSDLEG